MSSAHTPPRPAGPRRRWVRERERVGSVTVTSRWEGSDDVGARPRTRTASTGSRSPESRMIHAAAAGRSADLDRLLARGAAGIAGAGGSGRGIAGATGSEDVGAGSACGIGTEARCRAADRYRAGGAGVLSNARGWGRSQSGDDAGTMRTGGSGTASAADRR